MKKLLMIIVFVCIANISLSQELSSIERKKLKIEYAVELFKTGKFQVIERRVPRNLQITEHASSSYNHTSDETVLYVDGAYGVETDNTLSSDNLVSFRVYYDDNSGRSTDVQLNKKNGIIVIYHNDGDSSKKPWKFKVTCDNIYAL